MPKSGCTSSSILELISMQEDIQRARASKNKRYYIEVYDGDSIDNFYELSTPRVYRLDTLDFEYIRSFVISTLPIYYSTHYHVDIYIYDKQSNRFFKSNNTYDIDRSRSDLCNFINDRQKKDIEFLVYSVVCVFRPKSTDTTPRTPVNVKCMKEEEKVLVDDSPCGDTIIQTTFNIDEWINYD